MLKPKFTWLLAAACLLAACDRSGETVLTISARVENADTKTALQPDRSVWFTLGESIALRDGGNWKEFTAQTVYEDGSADFTGAVSQPAETYIAVSPYKASYGFHKDDLVLDIPSVQTAVAGSFDPEAAISLGCTENIPGNGQNLKLWNTCALIKFGVPEGTTYHSAVMVTSDFISGKWLCPITDAPELRLYDESEAYGHVSLQGTISAGNWYYIAVAPTTLTDGFAFYLCDDTETFMTIDENTSFTFKETEKTVTLHRSEILNLGIVGAEPGAAFEPLAGETLYEW